MLTNPPVTPSHRCRNILRSRITGEMVCKRCGQVFIEGSDFQLTKAGKFARRLPDVAAQPIWGMTRYLRNGKLSR